MASLNLSTNGPSITASYSKIVSSPPPSGAAASSSTYGQWALFSVQAPLVNAFQSASGSQESVLKVETTGEGELMDLIEDFNDGRIQFAFVKVKDPNTTLPKNVLIAWCGEGVPERTKGYFTSHLNAVSKVLHGYHVQVTARSDRDLSPELIVQKVSDASGSRYTGGGAAASGGGGPPPPVASKPAMPTKSFGTAGGFQALGSRTRAPQSSGAVDADGWGEDAPQVSRSQLEKVASAYQPTKVNMGTLQSQNEPSQYQAPTQASNGESDVVKGAYQPVGKVDIAALRKEAQGQGQLKDDRPTTVKGAYEPTGKVDIADIKRRAQGAPSRTQAPAPVALDDGEEKPKTLADRSSAFTQSERLTSLPRPSVANRFGSQASSFTGTRAPQPSGFEAKPALASAAPVGTASKTFADEGGKTPAQIWAEKKARERGASGSADTQSPSGFGGSTSPIQSQTSGSWQSGYAGKKWGVQIPTRTGGSAGAMSDQRTGEEPAPEEQEEPATGGVGTIRDRFKGAAPMGAPSDSYGASQPPPLDTASKPNAGAARGVPIPGLPQRPQDVPDEEHQELPPPPPRPVPQDEPSDDDEEDYQPHGSPIQVAMPVSRSTDLEKPEPLPPRGLPDQSLHQAISQHDPEPEPQSSTADPARGAGIAAAAGTFGAAATTATAGDDGGKEAIAQYDYEKVEDNELELRDGERITNIDMVDEDWWMGENPRGEVGLFPANYVELVEASGGGGAAPAQAQPVQEEEEESASASAIAQYDYEAAEDNELTFPDGGKITDIEFPDDDWWLGSFGGKRGLFPANYVELEQ